MAALGLYHYEQHFNFMRTRFIIYGLGLSIFVLGFTNSESNYFLVAPILYILAATGIVTLLNQWNKIFPINPFARTLALLPLAFAVLITGQYHLNRYFSAWALDPDVRSVYNTEPAILETAIERRDQDRILIVTNSEEHRTMRFLLNDARDTKQIDLFSIGQANTIQALESRYDWVYLDGDVEDGIKTVLDEYISEKIQSDRESKPVAYRLYDLKYQNWQCI